MANCCDMECEVTAVNPAQRRALAAVLAINAVMFVVLVAGALWGRTVALFADSFDNLGDAVTYAISIWAVGRGAKAKAQVSLLKGLLILAAAGLVIARLVHGLRDPQTPVIAVMGGFSFLALLANGACLAILWRHRTADLNMESVWHCSRNDIATNLSVIVAAGLVWLLGSWWPDIVVGGALAILLVHSGVVILRKSRAALRTATTGT